MIVLWENFSVGASIRSLAKVTRASEIVANERNVTWEHTAISTLDKKGDETDNVEVIRGWIKSSCDGNPYDSEYGAN